MKMTRRERMEARAERRLDWAESRDRKSEAGFARAAAIADQIPLGQPILVGHHSERHARKDVERIRAGMTAGCESKAMAEHHREKAAGLERQLERSVFSDDVDAVEQLEARIAEREVEAARYAEINKAWRRCKGDVTAMVAAGVPQKIAETAERTMAAAPWLGKPLDTGGLRAAIRRDRERIEQIRRMAARTEGAAAGGGVLVEGGDFVRVTFAEKPEREVLEALRAAGFQWGGGSWMGARAKLPACVEPAKEVAQQAADGAPVV
jgi:hypothetical protein